MKAFKVVVLASAITALGVMSAAADGGATFKAKCAACHGADGSASTGMGKTLKIRDLRSADVQKQSDADLVKITTDGKGKMPSYKGKLSDAEIKDVVSFIRTLKK